MTWPWATFFRFCFAALVLIPAARLYGGDLIGRVELIDTHGSTSRPHPDSSGVVVSLRPVDPVTPVVFKPLHAVMTQKNKIFAPQMLPIPVGSTVSFPNQDPIFHNVFSSYNGDIFDLGLYSPGSSRSVKFTKEGVVWVFCNIHFSTSAMIVVLPTPYFSVSQRDGSFRIANVPAGDYELRLVHERAAEADLPALSRRIKVPEEGLTLAALKISETSHTIPPHKDKYGHDYRPESDDPMGYPETSR